MRNVRLLLVSATLLLFTGSAYAQSAQIGLTGNEVTCKADVINPQGQGCCSWHGGECGCSPEGRDECCDGSLSPSCGCHAAGIRSEAPADLLARNSGYSSHSSSVHVRGYTRKSGTYVAPHMRTAPDSTRQNNWSTKGNVNPYTGKAGTKNPY